MKKYLFFLGFIASFLFSSCTKQEVVQESASEHATVNSYPAWLQEKLAIVAVDDTIDNDFAIANTAERVQRLAFTIHDDMLRIGRDVPMDVCVSLAKNEYSPQELRSIKDQYFYPVSSRSEDAVIKTRVVHQNKWHYNSTPGIYFFLVTHLNQELPEGINNAINYNTAGSSAQRVTFADVQVAGKALDNTTTQNLFQFDPLLADFNYYPGTGQPVIYSGWAFEMVYEDDVVYNGTTHAGPFGSHDGSNFNFPFMFATPANETFTFTPDLPDFPLYDALWYFPIQGLGAVYVLGEDL